MTVDINRIYQTILNLEGPRHPITSMDHLNYTADYIINELNKLDIKVQVQSFQVKGFEGEFRNIVGSIGQDPNIMLSGHYDSVQYSPGANDNLSAVALLLEAARLLKQENANASFAFFTLEEGNPAIRSALNEKLQAQGLVNEKYKYKYKSLDLLKASRSLFKKSKILYAQMYAPIRVYETLINSDLSPSELEIAKVNLEVYKMFPETDENTLPVVGSSYYVDHLDRDIKCVLNYDCIGWIKQEKGTQKPLPIPKAYEDFFDQHQIESDITIGNYLGLAGDINSSDYLKHFSKCMMDIPHLTMDIPLDHDQMKQLVPDLLRSDHRPFWRKGIPALFITDFANFRSELYHTPADESQHIDYEMLERMTKASVKFVLENQ